MKGKQGWGGAESPGRREFFREATSEGPDAVSPAGKLQFPTGICMTSQQLDFQST